MSAIDAERARLAMVWGATPMSPPRPPRQFISTGNGPAYCLGAAPASPLESNDRPARQADGAGQAAAPVSDKESGAEAAADTVPLIGNAPLRANGAHNYPL